MNKWVNRKKKVALLCYHVIATSHDQIEKTFDIVSDLTNFDNKRTQLQRMIVGYLDKYKSESFRLFPHALDKNNTLRRKDEWAKELNDLFCLRINKVVNERGHAWWAATTEEMMKTQIFFDSLKQEFFAINNEAKYVLQRQRDSLQFHWPDDTLFDKWMAEIALGEKFDEDEIDDDEVQDDEIQIIDTVTTQAQQEEEDKNDQSLSIAGPGPQDANTTEEEGKEEVTPTIQDKDGENLQVEINLP